MDYPVTNSTTNLLKFVHRHDNCTFAEIKAKFPKVDSMELVNLSLTKLSALHKAGRATNAIPGRKLFCSG